jgi:hypothetical protein
MAQEHGILLCGSYLPLNGDAMVVEVAGGGVAALGEVPAGMAAAEAAKKFRLGGPLPRGIHSLYFRHWRPMNVSPLLRDGIFVELMAVGDTDNGVNFCATWSRIMTKRKECEAAVLATLDAEDSEPIAATITCHRVWKTKKNASKSKSINKLIDKAKKDEEEIKAKKAAIKKKAAEKRKATSELRKAATMASVAAMASETPIDLTE